MRARLVQPALFAAGLFACAAVQADERAFVTNQSAQTVSVVALPQIPPRNVNWFKKGKWVHLGKIAFEKYFLSKIKSGNTDPIYEKYVLKILGIARLQEPSGPK